MTMEAIEEMHDAMPYFVRGYLEAAAWADGPEQTPAEAELFTDQSVRTAYGQCAQFMATHWRHLLSASLHAPWQRLGRLLWLSQQGHGTGYFDEDDIPKSYRDELENACRALPELTVIATLDDQDVADDDGPGVYAPGVVLELA